MPSFSECLFGAVTFIAWYAAPGWIAISLTLVVVLLWWLRGVADNFARDFIQEMLHPEKRRLAFMARRVAWFLAAALSVYLYFGHR